MTIESNEQIGLDSQETEPFEIQAPADNSLPDRRRDDEETRTNPWLLLLLGLLIGGLGGFYLRPVVEAGKQPAEGPLSAVESSAQINNADPHRAVMLAVIAGARHFYGDQNAPVTLIEFGDFNCGYCGQWAHQVLPLIDETYIKTGKVRMAYVHFPILGADSMTAAEASECAGQQDNFWEYHNLLYAHQGVGFTSANLSALAEQLNIDAVAFNACLANFPDRTLLDDDIRLAEIMGVRGTPAFLVNGLPLAGAYPYEEFERVIEGALAGQF